MKKVTVTQLRVTSVTKEDEAGLSLSKLVSKLEAGRSETRASRASIDTSIDNLKREINKSNGLPFSFHLSGFCIISSNASDSLIRKIISLACLRRSSSFQTASSLFIAVLARSG